MKSVKMKKDLKALPMKRGRPPTYPEWFSLVAGQFVITYPISQKAKIRASVKNYNARYGTKLKTWTTESGEIAVERIK